MFVSDDLFSVLHIETHLNGETDIGRCYIVQTANYAFQFIQVRFMKRFILFCHNICIQLAYYIVIVHSLFPGYSEFENSN